MIEQHRPEAITRRLNARRRHSYLADAVLGGIDGCVTTFAVIAAAMGAVLPDIVIVVLGIANLLADGFSMSVSNYLGVKSLCEEIERARREEQAHIREVPEGEREEIRQIFSKKGFDRDTLEKVVEVITGDDQVWIRTMLMEEHGLQVKGRHPVRAGLATFAAFLSVGLMPLLPFLIPGPAAPAKFAISIAITAVAFLTIGVLKGFVLRTPSLRSGVETLAVGGTAAALAYVTGHMLRQL